MKVRLIGVMFAAVLAFMSFGAGVGTAEAASIRTGAYARTTAALNMRSGPSTSYYVKRVVPYGASVYVNAGPYNSVWYKVTYSGTTGYVHGSYLTQGTSSTSTSTGTSTSSYSSKGLAIANTAKKYVGYRYAYYGNTPSEGFSCVGFTQWVYGLNGIYIPESLGGQVSRGWGVSRSNLRPGDLVFFQNTWWPGLSHAGVYVGNGWMIDASSPSTGVLWSNIYSSYYINKWYAGRRLVN